MSIPTLGKARQTGIPTPGKPTSIPTPGRARSASNTIHHSQAQDEEYISQAFADAIKANDPAMHRHGRSSDTFIVSLSPSSHENGRHSATGRPSSVASSSSAVSSVPPRTPTGTSKASGPRPSSRQSDVFARSSSRTGRFFDIGDNVRIESLGFEGTLRYLGEIDGKPGHWAGVELSGGFAGKGKNDGTVNGKQYFVCPPHCGVFVSSTKLSPPTVGYHTVSRPSSVASVRSGRITPSFSGRITPSASVSSTGRRTPSLPLANGRMTPSVANGRATPSAISGRKTPGMGSAIARSRSAASNSNGRGHPATPVRSTSIQSAITPGSRASKYVGMTAKQLSSDRIGIDSPSRILAGTGSPTSSARNPTSMYGPVSPASRSASSPFSTPKAVPGVPFNKVGMGTQSPTPSKTRPSFNTPRPRVPSAVAMPPPASPSSTSRSGRSISLSNQHVDIKDGSSLSELESNAKVLQNKIAELVAGRLPTDSRPNSAMSSDSIQTDDVQLAQFQARINKLEDENQRLSDAKIQQEEETTTKIQEFLAGQKQAAERIAELEMAVRTGERQLGEREAVIENLERTAEQFDLGLEKVKSDAEARIRDMQSMLDDKQALVDNLKELIEAKEGLQTENDAVLQAKDAEIALLQTRVQKAYAELEDERKELGAQVDELRKAGQETIALYEERLSATDGRRYELEDLIASLEEQLRQTQSAPLSPTTTQRQAASAAEIDNEALREQVQHLQKKVVALEDQVEEAHAMFDREDAAVRERVKKYKEREESMKMELLDEKKEVERISKSEENARQRIEEMEEALRENKAALENARAEIEGLRNEIAALESVTAGIASSNSSEKVAEIVHRSSSERVRLLEEIAQLKQQLINMHTTDDDPLERSDGGLRGTVQELQERVNTLQSENLTLQQTCDNRAAELDTIRKKLHRDAPLNTGDPGKLVATSFKYDIAAARDEITGLKHIVQELQKENSAVAQRNNVLEAENKLLLSETEQLRDDLRVLEENVEQSILREEAALASPDDGDGSSAASSGHVASLRKKVEAELEQVKKKLMESEMKSARTIHDLNKEIGELETLIEAKIYREDELERELERLKDKLTRTQKKSSKTSTEPPLSALEATSKSHDGEGSNAVCEICERPGHDIFTCDLLQEDAAPLKIGPHPIPADSAVEELFCEDCEGRGHTAANCPHSLDVF